MDNRNHYLTIAAFRIKEGEERTFNEVTLDDDISSKARIKKLCVCGSQILFDTDLRKWICSTSGTDLEITDVYCDPLLSTPELGGHPGFNMPEVRDPHSESVVTLDETGELEVFLKVQTKDQWIISDPLPIFENLSIKPFETDLLIRWYLSVGESFTGDLDFSIVWNIANPVHQRILKCLASSNTIPLYFLDATSLSLVGGKLLKLRPWTSTEVTKAFQLNATLPTDEHERHERLSSIALGQDVASLSFSEKLGICPEIALYLISPSKDVFKLSEHIKTCSLCQGKIHL